MDASMGAFATLVVVAIAVFSFSIGSCTQREVFAENCTKLSATTLNGVVYDCKKRAP